MSYKIDIDGIRENAVKVPHIRHKSETPSAAWRLDRRRFKSLRRIGGAGECVCLISGRRFVNSQMAQQSPSRKSREKTRVPLATLVDHQLVPDAAKLTAQVVFKETDDNLERLSVLARRARRQPAYVARAIFRVGLLAIENAIGGGLL